MRHAIRTDETRLYRKVDRADRGEVCAVVSALATMETVSGVKLVLNSVTKLFARSVAIRFKIVCKVAADRGGEHVVARPL